MNRFEIKSPNIIFFNQLEKYLFIDMIARYIKQNILKYENAMQIDESNIIVQKSEQTITKPCGASVLYTANFDLVIDCNIYRDFDQDDDIFQLNEFTRNKEYENIFSNIFMKKEISLKEAIEFYTRNKKRYNLCGLLLHDNSTETVLNPLHFFSTMSYIADGDVYNLFSRRYTAIYYTKNKTKYDECKNLISKNRSNKFKNLFWYLIRSLSTAITHYQPLFCIINNENVDNINQQNDQWYKILEHSTNLNIFEPSNYGMLSYTSLNIPKTDKLKIFRIPTSKTYDWSEGYNLISQGLLNIGGVIYPSYGLILANYDIKSSSYKGTSTLTPFQSVNVMQSRYANDDNKVKKVDGYQSNLSKILTNNVCVGGDNYNNTIHQDLAKLYHCNGNSSFHNNTQLPGFIQFMELSIEFSLKLWREYFERRNKTN